jgi:hypothetical protein
MTESNRRIILFLVFTYLIDWTILVYLNRTGNGLNSQIGELAQTVFLNLPGLVVLIQEGLIFREPLLDRYGIRPRFNSWYFLAIFFFPLLILLVVGISLMLPDLSYSPGMEGFFERFGYIKTPQEILELKTKMNNLPGGIHPFVLYLFLSVIPGLTFNTILALSEELAWRGFLSEHLEALGFWKSSLLVGLVWGVWQAPLVLMGHNYPIHPAEGVWMMILWCVLAAPLFSFIRYKTGTILGSAMAAGMLNAVGFLPLYLISGGSDLTNGIHGLPGILALAVADLLLFGYISVKGSPFGNKMEAVVR